MTNTCVVYNCMSGLHETDETVYLFHVPLDPIMKQKWVQAIPQTKEPLTYEHLVCHKHFHESDINRFYVHKDEEKNAFTKVPCDYPQLKDTAVPSIFPGLETPPVVENRALSPPTQVGYINDPVHDPVSDILYYSALNDLTRPTHCHHVGSFGPTLPSSQPPVSNSTINPVSNGVPAVSTNPIPGAAQPSTDIQNVSNSTINPLSNAVPEVSTNPITGAAQPSADIQNIPNGIGEHSPLIGTETVSTNIVSPPSVLPTESTGIVEQIATPSIADINLGNGISDTPASIVDSAISRHALTSDIDVSNTTGLGNVVTDSASNWDNVIVDEPVAGIITSSTPFYSSSPKNYTDDADERGCGDEDCCGDDCCGDDCCGDGCCDGCDDCGDCDCGDCVVM